MKTLRTFPGQRVALGHQGENLALTVIFNIGSWVDSYGPGTTHLVHMRTGDTEAYPVAVTQDGTEVSWEVSDADTAVDGYGKYELRYIVGETVVKSSVGETYVRKALQNGAETPEPVQGWLDHITEKEHGLLEAAENAEASAREAAAQAAATDAFALEAAASAQRASAMATGAQNAAVDAAAQADSAARASIAAGASADKAKAAADAAVEAVKNADFVKSVNGQTPDESGNVQIAVGSGSGVDVTAVPGQLIRVKSVDENGKPTAWEPVPWGYTEGETVHKLPGKFLPDGVPYVERGEMVEILAECQPPFDGDEVFSASGTVGVEAGATYQISWNGVQYLCTAQDLAVLAPGAVFMGNGTEMGFPGNGEPFGIMVVPIGDGTFAFNIFPLDGSTEVTISISRVMETVHKLEPKLLPDGAISNVLVVTTKDNFATATHTVGEIIAANFSGKAVLFAGPQTLPLVEIDIEAYTATFEVFRFLGGNLLRAFVVVENDGTISDYSQGATITI